MKKLIKFLVLILTISTCFIFAAFGCGDDDGDGDVINLNATEITLDIEKTYSLSASIPNKSFADFEWSVDNSSVVSVSEKGLVTGLRVGTATVTVRSGEISATCDVTVGLGDYVPAISLGATENVAIFNVAAGTPFTFEPYINYAGKAYYDGTFTFKVDSSASAYGSFGGNTFNASYTTGKVLVTVTGEWRGASSEFLTKTFEINVIDNVAISVNEGSFSGDINLYTVSSFKGETYPTTQDFRVSVTKNGVPMSLNVNNLAVISNDKNVAEFSSANNRITAKNFGSTTIKVSYTADNGQVYDAFYNVNVTRPVYRVEDKIMTFSSSQDTLNVATYAGAGATVVEAYQNGKALTIKNNVISGYTPVATGANESIFLFYTADQVGYQVIADVYGFVIRELNDLTKLGTYSSTSIALEKDLDATDAAAFKTIPEFYGSINGLGHSITNLKMSAGGLVKVYKAGCVIRDIAFINMIPTADSGTEQYYLCGSSNNNGSGTIENVYLSTDMGVATRGYRNSSIFSYFISGLNVRNVVIEFPSIPMTEETNYGYKSRYGLFGHNTSLETAGSVEAPRYSGLYLISEAVDGNAAPLVTDEKSMAYSNGEFSYNDGAYGYFMFASNDYTDMVTQTSDRYYVKTTYTHVEEIDDESLGTTAGVVEQEATVTSYFMYPQYTLTTNAQGQVVFTKLDQERTVVKNQPVVVESLVSGVQATGDWIATSGSLANGGTVKVLGVSNGKRWFSTYPGGYSNLIEGKGVLRFGAGVVRYDNYAGFISNKTPIGSFSNSWDVTAGFPQWKSAAEYSVKITANGNEVNKINLVYDKEDTSRLSAVLGLVHPSETLTNVSYEIMFGSEAISLSGATVTAIGAGTAFIAINFTMDGNEYTKYISVTSEMAPGEYTYAEKLALSAGNGKLYKEDAEGNFTLVELEDIFGMKTELTAAYMDGKKIALSEDKQHAVGASASGKEIVYNKELQLQAKNTMYNIPVDVYGLIMSTEEDLKSLNIPNTGTKLEGYFVLANDINCTTVGPINNHFNYYANNANTGTGDKSKTDFGFHGVFDGRGHTISGLYSGLCHDKTSGFFGFIGNGVTIKNVAFTDVRLTTPSNSMDVAYLFAYRSPQNNSIIENVYVEYSNDFANLPYSMSVGLFQGIHNTLRMYNVIVKMPTDPNFIYGSTFGWNVFGGFADDNPDSFIEGIDNNKNGVINESDLPRSHIFNNVYVISAPAANGKILPMSSGKLEGLRNEVAAYYLMYAANDLVDLPELQRWDVETRYEGANNDKVIFAKNLLSYDITTPGVNPTAYSTTEVSEYSQRNNTIAMRRIKTVYRYDDFAGLYNALQAKDTPTDQVGNWKISSSGIVWNEVNA